jgi:hypothetical protein
MMGKNVVQLDRPRRMRFATWITKATDIHSVYNTYLYSMVKEITRMRLSDTYVIPKVIILLRCGFLCSVSYCVLNFSLFYTCI